MAILYDSRGERMGACNSDKCNYSKIESSTIIENSVKVKCECCEDGIWNADNHGSRRWDSGHVDAVQMTCRVCNGSGMRKIGANINANEEWLQSI